MHFTSLWKAFVILILHAEAGNKIDALISRETHGSNQWKWACNQEGLCVRIHVDASNQPFIDVRQESLSSCRLTCGQFGALWPKPTLGTTLGTEVVEFIPSSIRFDITQSVSGVSEFLAESTSIFLGNLVGECGPNCSSVQMATNIAVSIVVSTPSLLLTWDTDESYQLEVTTEGIATVVRINSNTVFGARHGLETLSQLITSTLRHTLILIDNANIRDRPVYPHRGLTLDTARHFIPVWAIERTLDGMAATKMNVLHWHITDTQSFPLESTRVPLFTRYGAYSSEEVYTPLDIQHLYNYARYRGIRILMEIDAPAHAGNGWQWGEIEGIGPLAVCVNQQPWRKYCIQPPCGQLNPANPNVYLVLTELYRDIHEANPNTDVFHMGGDEVFFPCWDSSSDVLYYLQSQGLNRDAAGFLQLWANFQNASLSIWDNVVEESSNRIQKTLTHIILWSSQLTDPAHIEKYLQNNRYVIQIWEPASSTLPTELLNKGFRIIVSTKDAWYLDHGIHGSTLYSGWRKVYQNRILRQEGVLGGEACMWSEYVDENELDAKIWPRAAAVGERLWADPETDAITAEPRFYRHRERLLTRGLRPEAIAPGWCLQNEGRCK